MNQANAAVSTLQKMTDQIHESAEGQQPEFKTENGADDTNVDEITGNLKTEDKAVEVQDALKEWNTAWKMSSESGADAPKEQSFSQDIKQAHKMKERYHKVLAERRERMSR